MEKDLICTVCPIGCRLKITGTPSMTTSSMVTSAASDDLKISGAKCEKGITYARDEIFNPRRMVCTTVKIKGGIHRVIPVKTDKAIPEKYKLEVVKAVSTIELSSPVKMGDIVMSDLFGTGVNIVAERDM